MAGKTFNFRLITPQGKLMDTSASQVILPAHDGSMGALADHAPFVVKLGKGELRVDGGEAKSYSIENGFAQMIANRLTVLTTRATAK